MNMTHCYEIHSCIHYNSSLILIKPKKITLYNYMVYSLNINYYYYCRIIVIIIVIIITVIYCYLLLSTVSIIGSS